MYDPEGRRFIGPKGSAVLAPMEHKILLRLQQRAGRAVSFDGIINAMWGNPDDEPDSAHKSMHMRLWSMRRKLAAIGAPDIIRNIWGVGYMLKCEVDPDRAVPMTGPVYADLLALLDTHPDTERAAAVRAAIAPPALAAAA